MNIFYLIRATENRVTINRHNYLISKINGTFSKLLKSLYIKLILGLIAINVNMLVGIRKYETFSLISILISRYFLAMIFDFKGDEKVRSSLLLTCLHICQF